MGTNADVACQRRLASWIQLACVLLFAAMAAPFFLGRVYTHDDLGAFHLPVRDFYATQLARGESFDWMPSLYSGFYLTGEGQAGMYHPLHWLLYRLLPLGAAFNLELLLSYPLMLGGAYFWLWRWLLRRDAALFGALVFTFSGFNLLHFVHPNAIAVVAHIPWLLWCIDGLSLATTSRRRALVEVAIVGLTASQLLLGYPQYVWFSLLAEGGYAIWRTTQSQSRWGLLLRLVMAKMVGLLLAGVQILPTADALANSTRQAADATFANSGSLHPLNLIQFVAPYLFDTRVVGQNTHELGLYAGAVPLVLCVWLVLNRAHWGDSRRFARAALAGLAVALLLACGEYGGLYWLQQFLPLVNRFRFPTRAIVLVHLAMGVLSALAFSMLARRAGSGRTRLWPLVAISAAAAALGPLLWSDFIAASWLVACGPLLIAAAVLLIKLAERRSYAALVGLVVLTAVDQGIYGLSYVWPNSDDLNQYVAATTLPPDRAGARVCAGTISADQTAGRTGNRMLLAGVTRVDGYAGLEPARRLDYRQRDVLRLASVQWAASESAAKDAPNDTSTNHQWLEIPRPLPRARLVTETMGGDSRFIELQSFDVERAALVEEPVDLPAGRPGEATIVHDRPGNITVRTAADSLQLLIVAESWHRGWRATIDGRECPVMRVNGDFLGCVVGSGAHEATFRFHPDSLRWGILLSACGLGLIVCRVVVASVRPEIRRTPENLK